MEFRVPSLFCMSDRVWVLIWLKPGWEDRILLRQSPDLDHKPCFSDPDSFQCGAESAKRGILGVGKRPQCWTAVISDDNRALVGIRELERLYGSGFTRLREITGPTVSSWVGPIFAQGP